MTSHGCPAMASTDAAPYNVTMGMYTIYYVTPARKHNNSELKVFSMCVCVGGGGGWWIESEFFMHGLHQIFPLKME